MSPILKVEGLHKAFRGVHAVEDASFSVEADTITGLIGPNGSGKSTTIDCISGFQRADAGRIVLGGVDITHAAPATIARAGLFRTFQTVRVYESFSLLDNMLAVSAPFVALTPFDMLLRTRRYRAIRDAVEIRAKELIASIGMTHLIDAPAAVLSYGQKKLLAFAAAMMASPKLVVLDEPVAGVNPTRVNEVAEIIKAARREGTSFLVVEHNVDFIAAICDHVIVFDAGRKLTEGPAHNVQNDSRVLEAYLGVETRGAAGLAEAS
jgi:ABC-type branched-subunit amino acid transport system ATPase component